MHHSNNRTELILSKEGLDKLEKSKVLVVGLGGVGACAAEMLCRAGIGHLTLVDFDMVSETNINRQLIALTNTVGRRKTEVLKERLKLINNNVDLRIINSYINEENVDSIFDINYDYVVDAIDTLSPKVSLIKFCVDKQIPLISSMGAGAKLDPERVKITDISKSEYCPLAHMLRKRLHRLGIRKGFKVVFSTEPTIESAVILSEEHNKKTIVGTISYLPIVFGCFCASAVIRDLTKLAASVKPSSK